MDRYAEGDASAFVELYDALEPQLYRYLVRKMRNPARAEDIVQQTMLRVHCARGRFVRGSRVTPWVFAIATRILVDQVRRKKLELLTSDGDESRDRASDAPCPESTAASRELEALVRTEVEQLTEPQREAFELVHYGQMSHAEAAETLGVSVASIKLRLQRANGLLRDALRTATGEGGGT